MIAQCIGNKGLSCILNMTQMMTSIITDITMSNKTLVTSKNKIQITPNLALIDTFYFSKKIVLVLYFYYFN